MSEGYRPGIKGSLREDERSSMSRPPRGRELGQIYFLFQRGQLTGCKGFQEIVQKRMGRRVELRERGRPSTQGQSPRSGKWTLRSLRYSQLANDGGRQGDSPAFRGTPALVRPSDPWTVWFRGATR